MNVVNIDLNKDELRGAMVDALRKLDDLTTVVLIYDDGDKRGPHIGYRGDRSEIFRILFETLVVDAVRENFDFMD